MAAITLAARADATSVRARRPGLLRRLIAHVVRARTINVQCRVLNELPDHMLRDIGLCRSDIDYVARALADGDDDPTRGRGFYGA